MLAFTIAWLVQRLARLGIRRAILATDRLSPDSMKLRLERQHTLYDLITSATQVFVYLVAAIFVLSLFIDTTTIIWMIGLFSAAFGIGANTLIRDFLTGFSFIFEDTIDVGDKVEVLDIQGVVEKINLRTMFLRSTTGELYVIPNGEVRVIRNFSRGKFSTANVTLKIPTHEVEHALNLLPEMAQEAQLRLPNLIEPWQIIGTSEVVGEQTELTLLVKTRYGKAAESRPRLLKFVRDQLAAENIELVE